MYKKITLLIISTIILSAWLILPITALAQTYYFAMPQEVVNVFWNEDGTVAIDYLMVFTNDPSASPIDYVDVGIPNSNYSDQNILADIDGTVVTDISSSGYQGSGTGVAVGLGSRAIQPGATGKVHVYIGKVERVVYPDSKDNNYASGVFAPTYFGSQYVHGNTDLTVTFHLPPGVQPAEPRWHAAPSGFPAEPQTDLDQEGRVTYTWHNPNANGSTEYQFGASFPKKYIPDSAIVRFDLFAWIAGIQFENLLPLGCVSFFVIVIGYSIFAGSRRKLEYLPPKMSIEGHGIKRGLTAVEAAILMEQPMDKILTMILFAVVKKNAASVVTRDPLDIKATAPLPEGLTSYETDFLNAFNEKGIARQRALQKAMVELIKEVSQKMKGFSLRETIDYYRDITKRAWAQVEAANTPDVKSQKYDEVMEWTMLDKDYHDRTRDVFRNQPVFVPMWWGRYDPGYGRSVATSSIPSGPVSMPSGPVSMPHLPGSDFAASIVNGVQNFSSKVVGNITDFTTGVTNVTNPPPPPSTSSSSGRSSGGGCHSCACACACAGCACACAGGGR